MKILIALCLISLILTTGCTGFDLGSLFQFGSDVIKVNEKTITEGQRDILTITNIQTIPASGNILPDKPVQFSYILKNPDDLKTAENVKTYLYDAPTFKNKDRVRCNLDIDTNCKPNTDDNNSCSKDKTCNILPGEERVIKYMLVSPTNDEIVNIQTQPKLSFAAQYETKSSLSFVFPIVNFEEIIKRQRAGESIDLSFVKSHSSGPIQIDADLVGENYGLADYPVTVMFKIKDVGSASVKDSKILKGDFKIMIPQELKINSKPDEIFGKDECKEENGYQTCTNTEKDIDLLLDESQMSMRFELKLDRPEMANPFRSFQILSEVSYTYEIRGNIDVTVNPFGNI